MFKINKQPLDYLNLFVIMREISSGFYNFEISNNKTGTAI